MQLKRSLFGFALGAARGGLRPAAQMSLRVPGFNPAWLLQLPPTTCRCAGFHEIEGAPGGACHIRASGWAY